MSGVTKQMLTMWVDAVLRPTLRRAIRDGVPLDTFGSSLIGYGVSACVAHGMTDDQIRAVLEAALAERKPT